MKAAPLLILVALSTTAFAEDRLYVIVNAENPIQSITAKDLSDIYLGRSRIFPNGRYAQPYDQPQDSAARRQFYRDLVGKPISEINTYWARLIFTGTSSPPKTLTSAETVAVVKRDSSAVAYLGREPEDAGVRVVLTLPLAKPN